MDDELLDAHRLPRPRAASRRFAALGLRAYATGRRLQRDPAERSWVDVYGVRYGGCPHLPSLGPQAGAPAAP